MVDRADEQMHPRRWSRAVTRTSPIACQTSSTSSVRDFVLPQLKFPPDTVPEERLLNLERDHVRTLTALEEHGIPVPMASSVDGDLINGIMSEKVAGGSRWRDFNGRGVDGEAEAVSE